MATALHTSTPVSVKARLFDVLDFHVPGPDGYATLGDAWGAGLFYACLGCGTVGGINPEGDHHGMPFGAARRQTRDAIDWDRHVCCENTEIVTF